MIIKFDNFNHSRFIEKSWIRSFSKAIPNNFRPFERYSQQQSLLIKALLLRGADILVCVDPEDRNHILGWICFEVINNISIVHFIYTKASCRRNGIGKSLCEAAGVNLSEPILCTAITYVTKPNILGNKYKFIYLPELLNGLLPVSDLFKNAPEKP